MNNGMDEVSIIDDKYYERNVMVKFGDMVKVTFLNKGRRKPLRLILLV